MEKGKRNANNGVPVGDVLNRIRRRYGGAARAEQQALIDSWEEDIEGDVAGDGGGSDDDPELPQVFTSIDVHVIGGELMGVSESDQAIQCAVDQVPIDMPYVEVISASLFGKNDTPGHSSVEGMRWYVEVDVLDPEDDSTAAVLYRVWYSEGILKAVRVTVV